MPTVEKRKDHPLNSRLPVPDQAEQELRATASRLVALIEHLQAGVLVEDESRRIVHVNAELCAKFGIPVPPQDLIGADCSQGVQRVKHLFADPEGFVERVEELLRERQVVTGEELCLADGRIFERDYIPIFAGDEYRGNLRQYRDVTERKRSEEALRESEEMFRILFQHSPDAVILTDPHDPTVFRRIVAANEAACRMNGYSRDELLGRSIDLLHPERTDGEGYIESLEQLRREGTIRLEAVHRRRDGTTFPIETRISLVNLGGRELILGIDRDITERKQLEWRTTAFSDLAHDLNSGTTAVTAARIIAEAADDLIGWDAFTLLLYSPEEDLLYPVLDFDLVEGTRTEFASGNSPVPPGSVSRRAMEEGPQLLLREQPTAKLSGLRPFGDIDHPSASLMFVPIHGSGGITGVLSAQSYTPGAYTEADLSTLQALANHCGGALERIRAEEELRKSEAQHRAVVDTARDAIIVADVDGVIRSYNQGAKRIFGYAADEAVGQPLTLLMPDRFRKPHVEGLRRYLETGEARVMGRTLEVHGQRKDGAEVPIEMTIAKVDDGNQTLFTSIIRDITERVRTEEALRRSEERFRSLVRNSSDIIAVLDADATVRYVSPAAERVLGCKPEKTVGQSTYGLVHPEDVASARSFLHGVLNTEALTSSMELRLRHADGTWRHVEAVGSNLLSDPSVCGLVFNLRDITERKEYEEQLRHQAFHDPLTGLPNRALFLDRLEHALARTARDSRSVGVLLVDLDRFKPVNDSLGHQVGDELLVMVGRRLQSCVRPEDTVARLGGDEFAVLIEDLEDTSDATAVAERIEEALRPSFELGERELVLTASIGVAVSSTGQRDPDELLRSADIAMYQGKKTGKARYELFEPPMAARALELLELEADLRRALERDELRLHYQPKVELGTGRIVGVEALLRWEHPERGLVSPLEFIGLAEETGLILPIGRWVLREACRQAREWQEQHPLKPSLEMCVNVSARQFEHRELVGEVAQTLEETALDPGTLVLEITESAVMEDAESNIVRLHELKDLGVRLAIDDFGTGYSSLSYLHRFPVDTLKIDRSFVDGLGEESEDTAIVRAVIALAHSLRLDVIAEGVETAEQVKRLQALGCRMGQGYLFSRPLPSEKVAAALAGGGRCSGDPPLLRLHDGATGAGQR